MRTNSTLNYRGKIGVDIECSQQHPNHTIADDYILNTKASRWTSLAPKSKPYESKTNSNTKRQSTHSKGHLKKPVTTDFPSDTSDAKQWTVIRTFQTTDPDNPMTIGGNAKHTMNNKKKWLWVYDGPHCSSRQQGCRHALFWEIIWLQRSWWHNWARRNRTVPFHHLKRSKSARHIQGKQESQQPCAIKSAWICITTWIWWGGEEEAKSTSASCSINTETKYYVSATLHKQIIRAIPLKSKT